MNTAEGEAELEASEPRNPWHLVVTVLAGLTIALVLMNIALFERNRTAQAEVNVRAQYIQQTVQLERLHRELVNAIANLSVRNNDDALRTVLSQHGITFNVNPAPPAQGAPSR